jgi:hypothetical protein
MCLFLYRKQKAKNRKLSGINEFEAVAPTAK